MQLVAQPQQIACPRCAAPMAHLRLPSHGAVPVDVDHCQACRLIWFDALESVQLDSLGWVRMLRVLQDGDPDGVPPAATSAPACPGCREPLKAVHNRTRFGRFRVLECPRRHGHLHSHSGLLAERGLVRPLLGPERRALAEERHRIDCFNCGAPSDGRGDACPYCGSPLVVLDLPRLSQALRLRMRPSAASPEPGAAPLPMAFGRALTWTCRGCGEPLDPGRDPSCPRCGHLVVAPNLPAIDGLLDAAEADLRAAAAELAAATATRAAASAARREATPGLPRRRQRTWRDTQFARLGGGLTHGWGPLALAVAVAGLWWLLA